MESQLYHVDRNKDCIHLYPTTLCHITGLLLLFYYRLLYYLFIVKKAIMLYNLVLLIYVYALLQV